MNQSLDAITPNVNDQPTQRRTTADRKTRNADRNGTAPTGKMIDPLEAQRDALRHVMLKGDAEKGATLKRYIDPKHFQDPDYRAIAEVLWEPLETPDAPLDFAAIADRLENRNQTETGATLLQLEMVTEPLSNFHDSIHTVLNWKHAAQSTLSAPDLSSADIRKLFQEKAREISEPVPLDGVIARFRKWLYLEETGLLEVYLGAIAANLLDGDPVWLMIVGASGGGKTEPLNAAMRLHFVHLAATVTESSLLSGTPKREKAKNAKGGLLREVGPFGLLLLKDFTSMLAQRRDASAAVLSAFREIYDGSWTRHVGSDGGTTLHWAGKLAVIAGCTDTIDSHTAVIGTMGERFAFYRLPTVDDRKLSRHALQMAGKEAQMRDELSRAVCGLFAGVTLPDKLPEISEADLERLIDLASLTARCRSAVERDNHTRDITLTLSPEAPTRIAKILRQLFHGMEAIGVERPRIWAALEKIAFDSMHKVRRAVLGALENGELHTTTTIAAAIQYPTVTARRALEELHAHGVLICIKGGQGKADSWQFSDWTDKTLAAVRTPPKDEKQTFPVFQTDDISFSSLEEREERKSELKYIDAEKRERSEIAPKIETQAAKPARKKVRV
jgi:hypothetical protein